jgi:hypothetical protein
MGNLAEVIAEVVVWDDFVAHFCLEAGLLGSISGALILREE